MARLLKITTQDGSNYIWNIDSNAITGGSLDIKEGILRGDIAIGSPIMISIREGADMSPEFADPGVITAPVTDVRPI